MINKGQYKQNLAMVIGAVGAITSLIFILFASYSPVSAQSGCDTSSAYGTISKSITVSQSTNYKAWVRLWLPTSSSKSVKLSANTICKDLPGSDRLDTNSWVWVNTDSSGAALSTNLSVNTNYNIVVIGQAAGVRVDRVMFLSDNCVPTGTGDNCPAADTTAPTISISQPSNGQTVNGNVSVQFSISDLSDTQKVELLIDGGVVATSTSQPFSITWDSRSVSDGNHTISARLTDKAGNTSISGNQTISVSNVVSGAETSRIPADAYKDGGEGVGYHDTTSGNLGDGTCRNDDVDLHPGSEGCIIGFFATGEWLEYDVNVALAGKYTLQALIANGETNTSEFRLEIDGQDMTGTINIPPTGDWKSYSIVSSTVNLTAGNHTLRLYNQKQWFDLAWFQFVGPGLISLGEVVSPPPENDVISRLAIDSYNDGGEGVGYHDKSSGNNGDGTCRNDDVDLKASSNGCILGWFETGEWLQYDVNISKGGTYTLQLNTSRGESGNGAFRLEVDGNDVSDGVAVPSTGSWDTFNIVNVEVDLPEGQHTIRLVNEQQYFDVAWVQFIGPGTVELSSPPEGPPPPDETPPSIPANLKADSISQTTVSLSWSESVDTGSGVVGYAVYRDSQLLEVVLGTGYTDSNLNPDSTYIYWVSALDSVGNESSRATLTVKTKAEPSPPSNNPSADLNGDGQFTVADLALYKSLYKSKDLKADFNNDGKISVQDWAIFLAAWKEGR